ncbi:hypothetical protein WN55_06438 [Dufourea novaeangliae]|uniref:DRBM domain-containing protein n=1 Tax=Dufourea novaeangliae TaxID=178035 RepID=A0A154P2L9_DUFNO|nr:hypothetical protein WN55_06438 [Dufourea novaeangliae]
MSRCRDSTCQKNEMPKSLQGTEDAEFVWSMILERFPNAAPLLFEMEAVVDRAEDLLQQLRAPCQREIETSTSFCTPDSEDSTILISARESSTENNVEGGIKSITSIIQVSECNVYGADVNSNDPSQNSVLRDLEDDRQSNDTVQCSSAEKYSTAEGSASSNADAYAEQRAKEARSLEEWEKVVDHALKKSSDGEKSCVILHRTESQTDFGDSTAKNLKGNGDETSTKTTEQRTPVRILEEYAKRCKIPIVYQCIDDGPRRRRPNAHVIRGSLGGYVATARGESEESAKNNLATTILRMISNQQMNDEKPSALVDLSKEEILEIIGLGVESPRETAQRKLYQTCLEQDSPLPTYTVEKVKTFKGLAYVATCSALGYTTEGLGVTERVAKKSAADELYRRYCEDQRSILKVKVCNFLHAQSPVPLRTEICLWDLRDYPR